MEIMCYDQRENNPFSSRKITGFIGEKKDLEAILPNCKIKNIKENKKVKRIIKNSKKELNLLGLSKDILKRKFKDLSYGEKKLISLIAACREKPALVALNNFDLGFNNKIKSKISKYIKTINATYNINFIIISNDLIFINKNAKHIIIAKGKIIKYQGDIITALKQNLLEKPEIIKFIDLANEKGANINYTLDGKELLKSIYRSVF